MLMRPPVIPLLILALASPASSQIGLPPVGGVVEQVTDTLDRTVQGATKVDVRESVRSAVQLARNRIARLATFVRQNRDRVELDDEGQPARRSVVLILDADPAALDIAQQLGLIIGSSGDFGNLGLSASELKVPEGMDLARAISILRKALPDKTISADQLHFASGSSGGASASILSMAPVEAIDTKVGIIDSGIGTVIPTVAAKGFASGAPAASDHGTQIASLLRQAGVTNIVSADVYGRDPAGGSALAIVRALDWMAGEKVPVISISLVGPRNPLMERAVAAMAKRGVLIAAAVGNDGPAAPPAFPASYPSVIAVTGVDGRNRALIEAGRALHLDYAAPGADIKALDAQGARKIVRGTSFATPLVAARAAAALDRGKSGAALRAALDIEARDLGKKGPDSLYGRGLLCEACRPR
jgi:subtilisin family serine protease